MHAAGEVGVPQHELDSIVLQAPHHIGDTDSGCEHALFVASMSLVVLDQATCHPHPARIHCQQAAGSWQGGGLGAPGCRVKNFLKSTQLGEPLAGRTALIVCPLDVVPTNTVAQ